MKRILEYIWMDGNDKFRSQLIIQKDDNYNIANLPIIAFNGSFTKQLSIADNSIILKPIYMCTNPFHGNGYLVLCETYFQLETGEMKNHQTNSRFSVLETFNKYAHIEPMFTFEQDYYILTNDKPVNSLDNYCSLTIPTRSFAEKHVSLCLDAGLEISGLHSSTGLNQWTFSIGPLVGINACDQLIMARYILYRMAGSANILISLKPRLDDIVNGCKIKYSTLGTRLPNGHVEITRLLDLLNKGHGKYVTYCGKDTNTRLNGNNNTSYYNNFTYGVGNNTSIKIPRETTLKKSGYIYDLRPSANVDPYQVCNLLIDPTI